MQILQPRRSQSERAVRRSQIDYQKVLKYIEDGNKGNLHLYQSSITKLPNQLKYVGGWLSLYDTNVQSLPDNLTVKEDLYLENTKIQSLPNNLKVSEDLYLQDTPLSKNYTRDQIRQLIEDKGGYVKGKIYI